MPRVRLVGNAILSFFSKISSGYWTVFDSTNGYTAISAPTLAPASPGKISHRFFFESDMLFQLGMVRASVTDVPMDALYANEKSKSRDFPDYWAVSLQAFGQRVQTSCSQLLSPRLFTRVD